VNVVDTPFGRRPFRVHIDPTQDGADVGFAALERVRAEMLHRIPPLRAALFEGRERCRS